jgi:hypothetical protein
MEGRRAEFERLFIQAREENTETRIAMAGKQSVGYYSDLYICEMFGMLLSWKERDPLLLMAEIVRLNSFHHPRLTVKSLSRKIPLQFSPGGDRSKPPGDERSGGI